MRHSLFFFLILLLSLTEPSFASPLAKELDTSHTKELEATLSAIVQTDVTLVHREPFNDMEALILTTKSGVRLIALQQGATFLLGDLYSTTGRNLTLELAQKYGCSTVLEIFGTALSKCTQALKSTQLPNGHFASLSQMEGVLVNSEAKGNLSLLIFHLNDCPNCRNTLDRIQKASRDLPFQIKAIAVEKEVQRPRDTSSKPDSVQKNLRSELHRLMQNSNGTFPFYVFDDGTMGSFSIEEVLTKMTLLKQSKAQTKQTAQSHASKEDPCVKRTSQATENVSTKKQ